MMPFVTPFSKIPTTLALISTQTQPSILSALNEDNAAGVVMQLMDANPMLETG